MAEDNTILEYAFGLLEHVAPGSLTDPETAYRNLVDTMGWIVVKQQPTVSIDQLKVLQGLDLFQGKNLVQIKKAIGGGDSRFGPEARVVADLFMSTLESIGIGSEFIPLGHNEKQDIINAIVKGDSK